MFLKQILTQKEARLLDEISVDELGVSEYELMSRAGKGAHCILQECWPNAESIQVICGPGNNGGDGYVLATEALHSGLSVVVESFGLPKTETAMQAFRDYDRNGGQVNFIEENSFHAKGDVIVDALLGIGLTRAPEGKMREVIEIVNKSGIPVLSLDVPSGLNADTGQPLSVAFQADVTATFIGIKAGLLSGNGREHAGSIRLDTLDLPDKVFDSVDYEIRLIDEGELKEHIPRRSANTHKGSAGRVCIVGGNRTMEGAVQMAGEAALRSGAGLVSVATRANLTAARCPEMRIFEVNCLEEWQEVYLGMHAIGIGPGLGQDDWAKRIWEAATGQTEIPLVVDADALNLLADKPFHRENWILTPHPGEAARLLDTTVSEIQGDRYAAAKSIAKKFDGVAVLKGAGTIIASQAGVWICDRGNPAMATGGTGDILTGVISALIAQGVPLVSAAKMGVWLHAKAGDECAAKDGQLGLLATDLLPEIRKELNRLSNGNKN